MNSTVTSKFQTTIPKAVRKELGISVNDSLEWVLEKGKVVVQPVHGDFLRYQGTVKIGAGDITADMQAARLQRLEHYR
ncbi:MAG: hypothetical protein A2511_16690 [Deltaproteobacteria bacterium RIFOXYD12_FULL_50_9]|nr:MAG: hypothetical protein A2511_16690 [Deltaproteobacteria bacterium RIFOXYD12_FULL_50_9]